MARHTRDTLNGYAFGVLQREQQKFDNGAPLFNVDGTPKTETITELVFDSRDGSHIVVVPLSEEARQTMIAQLTGGVVVANGKVH